MTEVTMGLLKSLFERAKGIVLNPRFEWELIDVETISIRDLYKYYIMPMAAIEPVASIIGASFVGFNVPFLGHYYMPLSYSVLRATFCYVVFLVGIYLVALLIAYTARRFDGEADLVQALKLTAYSSTPVWILGVFSLVPDLRYVSFLGFFYTVYLLYLGLPVLMKCSLDKRFSCLFVAGVFFLLLFLVVSFVGNFFFILSSPQVIGGV
jgi:hypothetical protein